MSITRLNIAIDMANDSAAPFEAMARRSRLVTVVDDVESSTVLITNNGDAALAAVRNGRHALVVEPFSLPPDVRGELEASTQAMPAMTLRYQPAIRQVRNSLAAGKLGEPGLLRIHRWGVPAGNIRDELIGELDLALWLFSRQPSELYALERPGYLQAHIGFPGGGMALIDLDSSTPPATPYYSLSLIGSTGAAYADDHRNMNLLISAVGTHALPVPQGDVGLVGLIDEFAEAVQAGADLSSCWLETTRTAQVSDAVEQSAAGQQVVTIGATHG